MPVVPPLTPAQRKRIDDQLAEAIHTAFRKASDHPEAHKAWMAIRALPPKEWGSVIDFISDGLLSWK